MMAARGKLHIVLDSALAWACAAICAAAFGSAALYVLLNSPKRGLALIFAALILALLAVLAARFLPRDARFGGAAVFAAALALRAAAVFLLPCEPVSDFALMYEAAQSAAAGDPAAFAGEYFELWGYQIPFALYEALVIRLGGGVCAFGLLNSLYGAATALLVYLIALRFAPGGAALAAGLIYAAWPGALLITPVLTNQCISLCLMLLGVYLALGGGPARSALAGAAIALGNLMRPEAVLIFCGALAALVLALLARRGEAKRLLAGFACLAAGYIALTLAAGAALGGMAPRGIGNAAPEWKFVLGLDTATAGGYDDSVAYILSIADGAERRAAALEAIRASLAACDSLPLFFAEKAALFWGRYEDIWLGVESGAAYALRSAERAFFLAAAPLAFCGCLRRRESAAESLARGVLLAFFAVYLLIEIQSRYRYFIIPFLAILAAAGIKSLAARLPYGHCGDESV